MTKNSKLYFLSNKKSIIIAGVSPHE